MKLTMTARGVSARASNTEREAICSTDVQRHAAWCMIQASLGVTGLHVQPRLAVGDVSARQALILFELKNQMLRPAAPAATRR
jgi:hypothetical protein